MNIEKQLYALANNSGINYDIQHILNALLILDNPHKNLKYIHVAGTNGKGTTGDFIAQSLEALGKKVGFYSSPHVFSYTERFQINGIQITLKQLHRYFKIIKTKTRNISLTEFEILTLIAFLYFKDTKPDYVVMETGLGGRLDATNIIDPIMTVITTISFDHQAILGKTLKEIAIEKLGIMKPKIPLVTFEHEPELNQLFNDKAKKLECPLFFIRPTHEDYLSNNKLLAEKTVTLLGYTPKKLIKTRLFGRMQVISESPYILAEAAHNKEGIDSIAKYIKNNNIKTDILFSVSQKPKEDIIRMAETLSDVCDTLYITEYTFYKALPLNELIEITKNIFNIKIIPKNKSSKLIKTTKNNLIITGSIYFLGSVLK